MTSKTILNSTGAGMVPQQAKGVVHEQIASVAKGLAGEFWEQMCTGERRRIGSEKARASANRFRKMNPDQDVYVLHAWPEFIEAARGAMVALLGKRDVAEPLKEQIHKALLMDGAVNPRKLAPEAAAAMVARANRRG